MWEDHEEEEREEDEEEDEGLAGQLLSDLIASNKYDDDYYEDDDEDDPDALKDPIYQIDLQVHEVSCVLIRQQRAGGLMSWEISA